MYLNELIIVAVKHQKVIDPCPGYAPRTSIGMLLKEKQRKQQDNL